MISRDVLGVYLRTAIPNSAPEGITPELLALPPKAIASTTATKPPPLPSMQAFNAQLAVGGKDEALRKSASAFKTAAISMRRALASGERYWTDALKARHANWAVSAAPHLFGTMTRRAADNYAMDICISYGLEYCMPFSCHGAIHTDFMTGFSQRHLPTRLVSKQRRRQRPDCTRKQDTCTLMRIHHYHLV